MERLRKKFILILISFAILIIVCSTTVMAAGSFSISQGSATLTTGKTTTITVTANGCAGQFSISSSNTSIATVSTSSIWLDNSSQTITITAKQAGSASINITASDVTDTDLEDVKGTKSCSITVKEPVSNPEPKPPVNNGGTTQKPGNNNNTTTNPKPGNNTTTNPKPTKSNNSKLSSLKVTEGVISPEFNSSVKEYKVNVPNEVTKLSIQAITDDSKATVRIRGNDELKVGENSIEIIVTAEDGTTSTYKLLATRAEEELILQSLSIQYIDENEEKIDLPLEPQFSFDKYEYKISNLSHKVKSLIVDAKANKEKAQISIIGNEEIKAGENTITIKVTCATEAGLQEEKTYTIKVERDEEPVVVPLTATGKIKNWFSGIGANISKWVTENFQKIITGMLIVATTMYAGLTIYFIYDYKNYKKLLAKLAELNKGNLMEKANIALNPEMANLEKENEIQEIEEEREESKEERKGKRFK